ncbi:MAG TPA: NCS1 family nucleobase:cation symporter-1, partial [Paraburkholderia sp.]|nr:NCS1 family nucleobase:cation symporter-1 [Paraburkholderia sp.]
MAQFSAAPDHSGIPAFEDSSTAAGSAEAALPAGYSERLYNEDLAPLRHQTWGVYNIFAFWMSDVHSVGG